MKIKFDDKVLAKFAIDFVLANMEQSKQKVNKVSIVVGNLDGDIISVTKSFGKPQDTEFAYKAIKRFNQAVEMGKNVEEHNDRCHTPALVKDDVVVSCSCDNTYLEEIFARHIMRVIHTNMDLQQNWK